MKKVTAFIVMVSFIMLNLVLIPQVYAGELSVAEKSARSAGETAGTQVGEVIESKAALGWALFFLIIIGSFVIGNAGDDDDSGGSKDGGTSGHP
jgi:hypothetical protein